MKKEEKIVKARCRKTGTYYGVVLARFGSEWKAVDVIPMTDDQARAFTSEVRQPAFETNGNLLACKRCGNRKIGGCRCTQKDYACSRKKGYHFDCIYCQEMEIDYTPGRASRSGKTEITLEQGQKVQITFSNVSWKKFDNIRIHRHSPEYILIEPRIHVTANEQSIEFHGYNVSEMNEGVYYTINPDDDFEILCDVDTSTVVPHPRGYMFIEMGLITAKIDQDGGSFLLDGKQVIRVGQRFSMRLSLSRGGEYTIEIDGQQAGSMYRQNRGKVDIRFGFWHESHHCTSLTHAYVRNIQMSQTRGGQQ